MTIRAIGEGVQARLHAASEAAKRGALAVLVRSVTAISLRSPHTGALSYDDGVPQDPGRGGFDRGRRPPRPAGRSADRSRSSSLGARRLPDAPSANAIGELRGRERPDEIVLLGAHIDSWDVGQGASDDGAGCVAMMEALRLLRDARPEPRRTIRAVLFTGEEYAPGGSARRIGNGTATSTTSPRSRPTTAWRRRMRSASAARTRVRAMAPLLPASRDSVSAASRRTPSAPTSRRSSPTGAAAFDLEPDGHHYFDIHHTAADTLDKSVPKICAGTPPPSLYSPICSLSGDRAPDRLPGHRLLPRSRSGSAATFPPGAIPARDPFAWPRNWRARPSCRPTPGTRLSRRLLE